MLLDPGLDYNGIWRSALSFMLWVFSVRLRVAIFCVKNRLYKYIMRKLVLYNGLWSSCCPWQSACFWLVPWWPDLQDLTEDDLLVMADLFYLPFEHGEAGLRLLKDFQWLKSNCNLAMPHAKSLKRKEPLPPEVYLLWICVECFAECYTFSFWATFAQILMISRTNLAAGKQDLGLAGNTKSIPR